MGCASSDDDVLSVVVEDDEVFAGSCNVSVGSDDDTPAPFRLKKRHFYCVQYFLANIFSLLTSGFTVGISYAFSVTIHCCTQVSPTPSTSVLFSLERTNKTWPLNCKLGGVNLGRKLP